MIQSTRHIPGLLTGNVSKGREIIHKQEADRMRRKRQTKGAILYANMSVEGFKGYKERRMKLRMDRSSGLYSEVG